MTLRARQATTPTGERMFEVDIFALASNVRLPQRASARTRDEVPPGYGTQEQCLPFAAAAALGLLIPSPITFGLCLPEQMPSGARPFRSPMDYARPDGTYDEQRFYYVKDDPGCSFVGNAYAVDRLSTPWYEPGISFFDRQDQVDLFKVHLPYIWRTPPDIHTPFLSPINRHCSELTLYYGMVETEWYANPVNLMFRKPPGMVHIAAGDPIAQAVFVPRHLRRPALNIVSPFTEASGKIHSSSLPMAASKIAGSKCL